MKKYLVFNIVILSLVAGLLLWITRSRVDDFSAYHLSIAEQAATSAAQEIAAFIQEKERLVEIFGHDHAQMIAQLADHPDDEALHQRLKQRIRLYFPSHFTFTITDRHGEPYIEDFDGLVGGQCLSDLEHYAQAGVQHQRIHPHPEVYHFDVLTKLDAGGRDVILFISFHTDVLGTILRGTQTPGHQLLLIDPQAANLIEVTDRGARINVDREDYRLSAGEQRRILRSREIRNTRWNVVDLHNPDLFAAFRNTMLGFNTAIFALFLIVSLIMMLLVRREEKLRVTAERVKDEFLSVVSHELRTPITSIRGSLGLMAHGVAGDISPKARELTQIALNNSERLNLLINDLLDVQKIEAGKMEFDFKPMEIAELVRQCVARNAGYADKLGVSFQVKEAEPGLRVKGDENRLAQVMANLLSNAAKYGAERDTIEISVTRLGDRVRTAIRDHGPGIPESFRGRIFQKFAQLDAGDSRQVGGTGLGLSIAKMIVEEHGGQVGFESQTGAGTTFYVDLPLIAEGI